MLVGCQSVNEQALDGTWKVQAPSHTIWTFRSDHTAEYKGPDANGKPTRDEDSWRVKGNRLIVRFYASRTNPAVEEFSAEIVSLTKTRLQLHTEGQGVTTMTRLW
jgi:hypothetical protein